LVVGDIGDYGFVREVIEKYDIRAVAHLAAWAYVGESMVEPAKYFSNNVSKSLSLLQAIQDCGSLPVVFSSTCATYGTPAELPIREGIAQLPENPYGDSKLFIEKALGWYCKAYGMRSVSLRFFNAAGADPEGEIGEVHNPETHLIPLVIEAALGVRRRVTIYGNDYPTSDGTAVRDYVHVSDLAGAHANAVRYLLGGGKTTACNLGTGKGYSVRQIVSAVEAVSGVRIKTMLGDRRPGDPPALVADAGKAKRILDWTPRYPDLQTIVETAWNWHSSKARMELVDAKRLAG
jgi:UDP-glucose-4-epimerase GalE